jgi:3-oxoacyl-[acyl-carrier-protein] synthase-3
LTNLRTSFLFNIGCGAGALIVRRDHPRNRVLGTHLMSDGSMARHVIVPASGTMRFPSDAAVAEGQFFFDLVEPEAMKNRLNQVSMDNWMRCVDEALRKSGAKSDGSAYTRADIGFLDMLLVKPSAHRDMLQRIGLTEEQSVYLGDIGHIGEQDSIIAIDEGLRTGRLKDGDLLAMVGAGIGYVWAAGIVQWGPCE